jgi:hypothetical protein
MNMIRWIGGVTSHPSRVIRLAVRNSESLFKCLRFFRHAFALALGCTFDSGHGRRGAGGFGAVVGEIPFAYYGVNWKS